MWDVVAMLEQLELRLNAPSPPVQVQDRSAVGYLKCAAAA